MAELFEVDNDDILLSVHAQPGAGRSEIVGRHGDALKVRVAAPPDKGKANDAICILLAERFEVKSTDVELVSGSKNRAKRFRIRGVETDKITKRLRFLMDDGDQPTKRGIRDRTG